MRRPLSAALGAALAATVLGALSAPAARAAGRNMTGYQAPDLYVQQGMFGLASGATLYAFRGHPVVLKFFFTECPACLGSLPDFQRQYSQYKARGVQFIAVAYDTADHVQSLWRRGGYSIPVALDENGINASRYGVSSYPTNYVIGGDGIVHAYDDLSDWIIDREISRMGAAPAVATTATSSGPATTAVAERNLRELGDVPATLAAVKNEVAENDYGAVLRVVEAHFDVTKDPTDVVAAARRIEAIAKSRYQRRLSRIEGRRTLGDLKGAYDALVGMLDDFKQTQFEAELTAKRQQWRDELEKSGLASTR